MEIGTSGSVVDHVRPSVTQRSVPAPSVARSPARAGRSTLISMQTKVNVSADVVARSAATTTTTLRWFRPRAHHDKQTDREKKKTKQICHLRNYYASTGPRGRVMCIALHPFVCHSVPYRLNTTEPECEF